MNDFVEALLEHFFIVHNDKSQAKAKAPTHTCCTGPTTLVFLFPGRAEDAGLNERP